MDQCTSWFRDLSVSKDTFLPCQRGYLIGTFLLLIFLLALAPSHPRCTSRLEGRWTKHACYMQRMVTWAESWTVKRNKKMKRRHFACVSHDRNKRLHGAPNSSQTDDLTLPWDKDVITYMAQKFMLTSLSKNQPRSFLINQYAENKAQWKNKWSNWQAGIQRIRQDTYVNQSYSVPPAITQQQALNRIKENKTLFLLFLSAKVSWIMKHVPTHIIFQS